MAANSRQELESARLVLESQKSELDRSLARLDDAYSMLDGPAAEPAMPEHDLKSKVSHFKGKLSDMNTSLTELCSEIAVEEELRAAKKLRDERARIRQRALDAEAQAESAYKRAKARIDADIALERSIAAARRESDELEQARTELRLKREARERAELLYSSDIAATARRLRDREALLDRARGDLSSSYERQRLYDSIRRLRTARTSLTDQLIDFDTRSRRLASLYRYPALYDGVATRYYDSVYPYYGYRTASLAYPYVYPSTVYPSTVVSGVYPYVYY